ncbi:hypothetical protein BAT_0108 [Bacillus pumilus ATCC 7061]|nr:hypothetical protein BAT_0108 [Bacillus pumilus ATCC 7061]
MEDEDYQRMLKDLRKQAGYVERDDFDRDKFEQLRSLS